MNCNCWAYPFPHRKGGGGCCGCDDAPNCYHWERIADYYGTGDWDNVRFERKEHNKTKPAPLADCPP
jgi:hypothetical protein